MSALKISASSYSNTAPLIWSFLYGANQGKFEVILDNAPARSAELLARNRIDAALVPVIAYQMIDEVFLIPDVCVGAKEKVRSVCLVTKGMDLEDVKSVSLDISSKTSVALTKIIFREFLGFEPNWTNSKPNVEKMLKESDCALLIGDPALSLNSRFKIQDSRSEESKNNEQRITNYELRVFDLVELWREFTGFGFVFAMWMTRNKTCSIDFAEARDEGLNRIDEIIANYQQNICLTHEDFKKYLTKNISYSISNSMQKGLKLYYDLAFKHKLIEARKSLKFIE